MDQIGISLTIAPSVMKETAQVQTTVKLSKEYVATVKNEEKLKQYLKKDERHTSKGGR